MAAAGTSPALNLREKLAEFTGLKQRVSPDLVRCDFTNLVTNGGFDTDTTGWTTNNATAVVSAGVVTVTNSGAANGSLTKSHPVTVGKTYALLGTPVDGTGVARIYAFADFFVAGSSSIAFTAVSSTISISLMPFGADGTNATFDNIAIYEADPSDDAPWLRLPFGYKVGTRGMIVRDGVVLHPSDYTEITDSGQTFIKPIVAPGVSTEFSIWAGA